MNKEEAIEVYNGLINTKIKEAFEFFAPELRESKDERIRNDIMEAVENYLPYERVEDIRAYLERQKEQPISAEEILTRAGLKPYKDGNQWCILAGDNIQEGICGFGDTIDEALYEFLKEVLDFQKKQKPALTPERIHPKFAVGDTVCRPMWSDHTIREIYVRCNDPVYVCVNEEGTESHISFSEQDEWERKEQKPAESDAIKGGDFISDGKRAFLVLANVKERNLGETGSTFCEGLILGVDGVVYCDGGDFKKFKRATSDERAKFIHDLKVGVKLKEQPAEWGDEDELMRTMVIQTLETFGGRGTTGMQIDWLKSLRPSWKPSEQEKGALRTAIRVLTEERNFPKAASHLQAILDAFDGKESRKDWKPSEEQMEALEYVIRDYIEDGCNATANYLQEILDHLKNM